MNKKVIKYLFATYGRKPGMWFAIFAETIRAFNGRVITVVLLATMAAAVSTGDLKRAQNIILLWAGLTVVTTILSSAGELVAQFTENEVYGEEMKRYYSKLTNKDMAFYRNTHTGSLTAMFRQFIDSGMLLIRLVRGDITRTFISLTFPAVVLLIASWQIGVVAIILIVVQIIYMVWASSKANKYRFAAHEVYREISGEVADDVTNIIAYKSSGKEKAATKRISDLRDRERSAFWERRKIGVYLDFPRNIVTIILITIAFWFAIDSSSSLSGTVGLLVLTITYMFQILRNVTDLPDIITRYDDLVTKIEPTMEILTGDYEKIKNKPKTIAFSPSKGQIKIQNLNFKYGDDKSTQDIFSNLNLTIDGGQKLGIVGLSGAGKSTLASLIMRFDDIQSGEILVDGVDIRDVDQSELRSKIAYVPQEPILFHRSVRENIAYHNHNATDAEIESAARAAHAHEFIEKLPKKYETIVGERGVKLSGGQKQRVVIARAILKKAPILLFDEATSALDSESEHIIQKALPEIIGSHTAIIIAHRLSTVAGLDKIIVMHDGKIVEEGTHKQLLAQKGRYYSLWKRQTA